MDFGIARWTFIRIKTIFHPRLEANILKTITLFTLLKIHYTVNKFKNIQLEIKQSTIHLSNLTINVSIGPITNVLKNICSPAKSPSCTSPL